MNGKWPPPAFAPNKAVGFLYSPPNEISNSAVIPHHVFNHMNQSNKKQIRDVIIVGAGPAGSNAAMVLARVRRSVLIIDNGKPRNGRSHGMHNYLTRDGILPSEYLTMAHEELGKYGVERISAAAVRARKLGDHGFEVEDSNGEVYLGKRLLLATGVTDIIPDIPGMEELWGNGVYHCPYCDGYELCDQNIGLYARKHNGFGMAIALRQLSASVILFTDGRGYLSADQHRQLDGLGIRVVSQRIRELSCSEDRLTCVSMQNGESIPCDAVFVNHGHKSNNDLLIQLGARLTSKGAAITNRKQACSVPGLYVAGDAAIDVHFVIVAAAEGAKAAVAIHDDLLHAENHLAKKEPKPEEKIPA
jgi:thioredoxin reductase